MFKNFLLDERISGLFYLFGEAINTAEVVIGLFCVITGLHMSAFVSQKDLRPYVQKKAILLIEKSIKQ